MHGYELKLLLESRQVRDWAGTSRAQVYYSLSKLHRDKLISPVKAKPVKRTGAKRATATKAGRPAEPVKAGRKAQVYRLTATGRDALADALERPDWATRRELPPFLTWMALSPHARPGVASQQLERRRQFLEAELERKRATLVAIRAETGTMVEVADLMVQLIILQMEVEIDWLGG